MKQTVAEERNRSTLTTLMIPFRYLGGLAMKQIVAEERSPLSLTTMMIPWRQM